MDPQLENAFFIGVLTLPFLLIYAIIRQCSKPYKSLWNTIDDLFCDDSEKSFYDPSTGKRIPCPTHMIRLYNSQLISNQIFEDEVELSVIIPAYNEQSRLPKMMDEAIRYLENRSPKNAKKTNQGFTYEIIVVDDGSNDETTQLALVYSEKFGIDRVRVLTLTQNRGKGGAVRIGVLVSRGRRILFADADGASKFSDIEKLDRFLDECLSSGDEKNNHLILAIGSRAHLEKDAIATRSLFRTILMKAFHFLVWSTCVRTVSDTQCGFKMFTRPAAYLIFNAYHNESWAFDVELLYIAERLGCRIGEIPVTWQEIEGSKVVPIFSWLKMGRDVIMIAINYSLGIYRIPSKSCNN